MTSQLASLPSVKNTEPRQDLMPVSIVVPCYNESAAVDQFIENVHDFLGLSESRYKVTFVIVDDGSSDDSFDRLRSAFATNDRVQVVQNLRNMGVASAIMTGIRHAETEVVCSIDFDCTYSPSQLLEMIPMLRDGVDMVTASPYHPQGVVRNVPQWRLRLSKCASGMYRRLLRNKLHTYTSCFRVYRRTSLVDLPIGNQGFVGVAEMLCAVDRRGGRILEYPAELGVRRYGQSKMRTMQVTIGHLQLMLRQLVTRALGA